MATRAYRSKIGRLPFAVRHELNERLRDGATAAEVLTWLNIQKEWKQLRRATGWGDVTPQNLTDWRNTGYGDWLMDQARADNIRAYAESAQTIAAAAGGDAAAVGSRILSAKILDILEYVDVDSAKDLANAISKLRKGDQDDAKLKLDAQRNALAREQLELARDKFRRDTCELFLRWYDNRQALDIAAGGGSNEEKIQALLAFMDAEESRGLDA